MNINEILIRDEDPTFFSWIRLRWEKKSGSDLDSKWRKKIFIFVQVGKKFDLINHHFKLEFVDSGLYFVQDENNFINPLLQVGSGSNEKSNISGSDGPKINGSDCIRILIPDFNIIKRKIIIFKKIIFYRVYQVINLLYLKI